jgi:hypothetical protein
MLPLASRAIAARASLVLRAHRSLRHSCQMDSSSCSSPATLLNQSCHCISLDDGLLDAALAQAGKDIGLEQLVVSHPSLFSRSAVFADSATLEAMQAVVAAIERVIALPSYQRRALASAHPHAHVQTKARGVFLGFDFHLGQAGPQLIEINTNAGGALLNVVLRQAQRACCEPVARAFGVAAGAAHDFLGMFEEEWRLARGAQPLRRVAIVDDEPERQYLYPEFLLFQRACEARGIACVICDARELQLADQRLCQRGEPIDLVYNRLTDFLLERPEHSALASAFVHDLALVTPHPRAYALYADKARLALLSEPAALLELGASHEDAALLARHVPRTVLVASAQRDALWRDRKQLFFKPQTGYGSKAAYRGDKITRKAFEQLFEQPYVAQALVPPSTRTLRVNDEPRDLKLDVRNFAYAGRVQLVCARLYQGQTTNFRSEGGGFAPIYMAGAGTPPSR